MVLTLRVTISTRLMCQFPSRRQVYGIFVVCCSILSLLVDGFVVNPPQRTHNSNHHRRLNAPYRSLNQELLSTIILCESSSSSSQHPENESPVKQLQFTVEALDRRTVLQKCFVFSAWVIEPSPSSPYSNDDNDRSSKTLAKTPDEFGKLSKETIASLQYERKLGNGTFKQVYSTVSHYYNIEKPQHYAMAVERLTSKSEARDELRGIRIVEQIQDALKLSTDQRYFESIESWWLQCSSVSNYEQGVLIFPNFRDNETYLKRSRKKPTSQTFVKQSALYLISFKPLYDMDLKRFASKCRSIHSISSTTCSDSNDSIAGVPITEAGALKLVYEICHAGKIMNHDLGIVHRDIKPKNIMLRQGHVVIIDFGFANYGKPEKSYNDNNSEDKGTLCITEIGKVKGEVKYVLATDVALYRGCKEGDAFAFGRTIYETMFLETTNNLVEKDSGKQDITVEASRNESQRFRTQIYSTDTATESRFPMSCEARDCILNIVRGLCRNESPISMEEAEQEMKHFMLQSENV